MSFRSLCALALATACGATALSGIASATAVAPSNATIQSAKGRAAALEAQIAAEAQQQQVDGERYDQTTVLLSRAERHLSAVRAAIAREARKIHLEKGKVRQAAVSAYVYGQSASAQFGTVLTGSINDLGTLTTYAGVATNTLHSQVVQLSDAEVALQKNESAQQQAVDQQTNAATAESATRANLDSVTNATRATLNQVNGQLAQLIAQQEAAAAAAAEAAAQAAQVAAARIAAAQQAAAAAAVAQAIASSDPSAGASAAATAATTAASSASAVGQPTVQPSGSSQVGNAALSAAESFLGVPYVWGGASRSGMDCSGLTMVAWAQAGVNLAHSAWYQYQETTRESASNLQPGDLIFYYFPNDGTTDPVSHVAMYVGSGEFGSSTVIQAPDSGQLVSFAPMSYLGLVGYGRPILSAGPAS